MKILIVTESYWPNADGGALFERRLALSLAERGHQVVVWAPGTSYHRNWQVDKSYRIRRERAIRFIFNRKYKVSFWPWLEARRLIVAENPDIIHIHNPYWMGLAALGWSKIYKIPTVGTNHFMPENALLNLHGIWWLYKPLHRLIWKYLVWFHNCCNFITSPTPTAIKLLVDNGLRKPSLAISNGIDTTVFHPGIKAESVRQKLGITKDIPVLLYVGRVDGEKRLDVIIKAIKLMLSRGEQIQLVIAGYGNELNNLKSLAKSLGIERNLIFTGFIDEDDKPAIYNLATAFVIASPAELQSIVTLEAMASGLSILAVDVAALKELCHNGKNGYLFPEGNSQKLSNLASQLLTSPDMLAQFGNESRRIVQEHHDTKITIDMYEKAYTEAMQLLAKPEPAI